MGTFFRAPDIQAPIIPLDWDPLTLPAEPAPEPVTPPLAGFATSEPAPSELPAAPANTASTAALFHAFLEGAGLPNANIEADDPTGRMRAYGEILRELISGVRELLAVRTLTKSEFRIEQTMIRPAGNNPLKFSVDLDQAVSALLLPQRSGYTEPLPATREAIADLKSHEVSLIAGMQSSVAKLLAALSPDEVEKHVESAGILGSLVPAARKARYWEAYAATFDQVTQEYHEDVQSSFRRAFADAYFDQAKKL
jgi:type VI secretion system FHA domain protein